MVMRKFATPVCQRIVQTYINNLNNPDSDISIRLDHKCTIFQTLPNHFELIQIDFNRSSIYNTLTNTYPMHIHGNGGIQSKYFFNSLNNYINLNYRLSYGCKDLKFNPMLLINSNIYPLIYIYIRIDNINNISNLDNILNIDYPANRCIIHYINL